LRRHWLAVSPARKSHLQFGSRLSQAALQAKVADERLAALDHLTLARNMLHKSIMIAFSAGDHGLVANLARAVAENVERSARMSGEWHEHEVPQSVVNNFLIGDVSQLLQVLRPYPEARAAIAAYYGEKAVPKVIEHHVPAEG
jgi:hypothetical protein